MTFQVGDVVAYEILDLGGSFEVDDVKNTDVRWKWSVAEILSFSHAGRICAIKKWTPRERKMNENDRRRQESLNAASKTAEKELAELLESMKEPDPQQAIAMAKRIAEGRKRINDTEATLEAAKKSLNSIDDQHLREMRSYVTPPSIVRRVLECVLLILDSGTEVASEKVPTWEALKQQVKKDNFIPRVRDYDIATLTVDTREKVKLILNDTANFSYELAKRASFAAGPLFQWVEAQINLSFILDLQQQLEEEQERRAAKREAEGDNHVRNLERMQQLKRKLKLNDDSLRELVLETIDVDGVTNHPHWLPPTKTTEITCYILYSSILKMFPRGGSGRELDVSHQDMKALSEMRTGKSRQKESQEKMKQSTLIETLKNESEGLKKEVVSLSAARSDVLAQTPPPPVLPQVAVERKTRATQTEEKHVEPSPSPLTPQRSSSPVAVGQRDCEAVISLAEIGNMAKYLYAAFDVTKLVPSRFSKDKSLRRIWIVDGLNSVFHNMDANRRVSKSFPFAHLLSVERDILNERRVRLIFYGRNDAYDLLLDNAFLRERFYELCQFSRKGITVVAPVLLNTFLDTQPHLRTLLMDSDVHRGVIDLRATIGKNSSDEVSVSDQDGRTRIVKGRSNTTLSTSMFEDVMVTICSVDCDMDDLPRSDLKHVLPQDRLHDIVVVGVTRHPQLGIATQHGSPSQWDLRLGEHCGPRFMFVASIGFGDSMLTVLARKSLIPKLSGAEGSKVQYGRGSKKTSFGGMGVAVHYLDSHMCFMLVASPKDAKKFPTKEEDSGDDKEDDDFLEETVDDDCDLPSDYDDDEIQVKKKQPPRQKAVQKNSSPLEQLCDDPSAVMKSSLEMLQFNGRKGECCNMFDFVFLMGNFPESVCGSAFSLCDGIEEKDHSRVYYAFPMTGVRNGGVICCEADDDYSTKGDAPQAILRSVSTDHESSIVTFSIPTRRSYVTCFGQDSGSSLTHTMMSLHCQKLRVNVPNREVGVQPEITCYTTMSTKSIVSIASTNVEESSTQGYTWEGNVLQLELVTPFVPVEACGCLYLRVFHRLSAGGEEKEWGTAALSYAQILGIQQSPDVSQMISQSKTAVTVKVPLVKGGNGNAARFECGFVEMSFRCFPTEFPERATRGVKLALV